jgi:hypothetical protein
MAKLLSGTRIYGTATVDTQVLINGGLATSSTATGSLQVVGGAGISGSVFVGGVVTATTYYGTFAGSINTATNIANGTAGQIPYQTAAGATSFFGPGSYGQFLMSNGANAPLYQSTLTQANGNIIINSITSATSTNTGALQVQGGVGVGGSVYASALYDNNARVWTTATLTNNNQLTNGSGYLTSATIGQYGVASIQAGTGISVSSNTGSVTVTNIGVVSLIGTTYLGISGASGSGITLTNLGVQQTIAGAGITVSSNTGSVTISSTETLLSVTNRGSITSNAIQITNATAGSTNTGALQVTGGVSVGGALYAGSLFSNNAAVWTTATLTNLNQLSNGPGYLTSATVGSYGVASIQAGTGISVSGSTGSVTVTNIGVVSLVGSTYLGISAASGSNITLTNLGVQQAVAGSGISVSGSTGSVTISSTETLLSVTNRGSITSNAINITNTNSSTSTTTGALTVAGGVGIGGAVNIGQTSTIAGANIWTTATLTNNNQLANGAGYITSATLGVYGVSAISAGTDTAVSASTGSVTIWNISTLQSITNRSATTTNVVYFANGTQASSPTTGALIVAGGLGISGNIYSGGPNSVFGDLASSSTFNVNATRSLNLIGAASVMRIARSSTTGDPAVELINLNTQTGAITTWWDFYSSTGANNFAIRNRGTGGVTADLYANFGPSGTIFGVVPVTISTWTNATSTTTGALVVSGGAGIGGNLYATAMFSGNAAVWTTATLTNLGQLSNTPGYLTSATLGVYGVSSILSGTDTAVSTATGAVTVWNTSTLQSITSRGATTPSAISITNTTDATNTTSAALIVTGGVGIGGGMFIGGSTKGVNLNTGTYIGANIVGAFTQSQLRLTYPAAGDWDHLVNSGGSYTISGAGTLNLGAPTIVAGNAVGGNIFRFAGIAGGTTNITTDVQTGVMNVFTGMTTGAINMGGAGGGKLVIAFTTTAVSTQTGALQVRGGAGISGDLYVNGIANVGGALVWTTATLTNNNQLTNGANYLTSATIGLYGVSSIQAGSGISVSANTGSVTVSSTDTLLSVTNRGAITSNAVQITNTSQSASTNSGQALLVTGGVGIGGSLYVGSSLNVIGNTYLTGDLYVDGTQTYVNATNIQTGDKVLYLSTGAGSAALAVNSGIAIGTTATPYISWWFDGVGNWKSSGGIISNNTLTVLSTVAATSTATGALQVQGGVGVGGSVYASALYDNNARVWTTATLTNNNQLTNGSGYLTSATIGIYGVSAINAGTDTAVSTATGSVTVWDISTLQSVTGRGATTNNAINITNGTTATSTTTGALIVAGGVGIGGNVFVGGTFTSTGNITISSPQPEMLFYDTVTGRLGEIGVNNTYDMYINSTNGGGYLLLNAPGNGGGGRVGVNNASPNYTLDVGGTLNASSNLTVGGTGIISSTAASTSTTTGALVVSGGAGIGGNLYASAVFSGNAAVWTTATLTNLGQLSNTPGYLTSATLSTFGVSAVFGTPYLGVSSAVGAVTLTNLGVQSFTAGSGISTTAATGTITVSSTDTLLSVTNRGSITSNIIQLTNTVNATNTQSGALQVTGGVGIQGSVYAGPMFSNNAAVWTTATLTGVGQLSNSAGYITSATIGQYGVASIQAGLGISISASTGSVTVTNIGVISLAGTQYIGISSPTGSSIALTNLGVQTAVAGADIAVSTSTGTVVISGTGTFQSVTNRGAITSNAIQITNATAASSTITGALIVTGGVGIGGNIYAGNIYSNGTLLVNGSSGGSSTTATNLAVGTVNQVPYQSGTGVTTFSNNFLFNGSSLAVGGANFAAQISTFGGTGDTQGLKFQAAGWPYYARAGINGTVGSDFIISSNWNAQTNALDTSTYSSAYIDLSNSGFISFGVGASAIPSERGRFDNTGGFDIGYTSSQGGAKLSVNGGAFVNGTVTATNFILGGQQVLTTANLSSYGVTTFSGGTTGLTPTAATAGAITLAGTLGVANGGTGLTSLTANYIPYGAGTGAFAASSNLQFNGTTLTVSAATVNGTFTQGSGYAYLGNYNSNATTYPTLNVGTAFANNWSAGSAESNIWNTFNPSTYTTTGLRFMQLVTASSARDLMFLRQDGALSFGGTGNIGTAGYILQSNGAASPTWVNPTTIANPTPNALTMNNSGTGAASGTTFNGSSAITLSYNTIGASPLAGSTSLTTLGTVTAGTWNAGVITATYGGTGVAGTLTGISYMNGASAHTVASSAQILSAIGTIPASNGGTGAAGTLTGYVYANGAGAMTASTTIPASAISGGIPASYAANINATANTNAFEYIMGVAAAASTSSAATVSTTVPLGFNASTGLVGIGNSSPQYKLDVGPVSANQSINAGAAGLIRNASGADASPYTQARIVVYGGTGVDVGQWGYLGYGNDASMRVVYAKTAAGAPLYFGTSSAMDGTGTFSPTLTLATNGNLTATGLVTAPNVTVTSTATSNSFVATGNYLTGADVATSSYLAGSFGNFVGRRSIDGAMIINAGQAGIVFTAGTPGSYSELGRISITGNSYFTGTMAVNTTTAISGYSLTIGGAASAPKIAGAVTISDTPPANPTSGTLWWDSTYLALRIYYATSAVWVDALTTVNGQTPQIIAGTDISSSTAGSSPPVVTINDISTLQSVTGRGAATSNAISITNSTNSSGYNNGALIVTGGAGFGGNLYTNSNAYHAGALGVGTTAPTTAGQIYATNSITAFYSDERLKTKIATIENALDKVDQLTGFIYTSNELAASFGYTDQTLQVGISAQAAQRVQPEVVKPAPFDLNSDGSSKSGENYLTVQYEKLVPLLIEAIKELRAEVNLLKGK